MYLAQGLGSCQLFFGQIALCLGAGAYFAGALGCAEQFNGFPHLSARRQAEKDHDVVAGEEEPSAAGDVLACQVGGKVAASVLRQNAFRQGKDELFATGRFAVAEESKEGVRVRRGGRGRPGKAGRGAEEFQKPGGGLAEHEPLRCDACRYARAVQECGEFRQGADGDAGLDLLP